MLLKVNDNLLMDYKTINYITIERSRFISVHSKEGAYFSFECESHEKAQQELNRIFDMIQNLEQDSK